MFESGAWISNGSLTMIRATYERSTNYPQESPSHIHRLLRWLFYVLLSFYSFSSDAQYSLSVRTTLSFVLLHSDRPHVFVYSDSYGFSFPSIHIGRKLSYSFYHNEQHPSVLCYLWPHQLNGQNQIRTISWHVLKRSQDLTPEVILLYKNQLYQISNFWCRRRPVKVRLQLVSSFFILSQIPFGAAL